jgi:hypothetical protein
MVLGGEAEVLAGDALDVEGVSVVDHRGEGGWGTG